MKKKPRFFCDNCGCEVDSNAKACPQCGRLFASVRCPACGFTGEEKLFTNGCPSCGYSATGGKSPPQHAKKHTAGSPAPWVYIFSVLALLVVVAILSYVITR